jgi:hypothetical protein
MAQARVRTITDLERELKAGRARLASTDHELAATRNRLEAFSVRYRVSVGDRFEVLRTLQGQSDPPNGVDGPALNAAQSARPKTRPGPGLTEFERIYRDLARRVHPDLAQDPDERVLRTRVMAELNSARETLDFERARQLIDAWEMHPEEMDFSGGIDQAERLLHAIDRVSARLTAVTANLTRLQNSNLHLLLNIVEAQQRAGVDVLAETAADLDLQIAEARSKMSVAARPPVDLVEPQWHDRRLAVFLTPSTSTPAARATLSVAALLVMICIAALAATLASSVQRDVVFATAPSAAVNLAAPATEATPAPLSYRVAERKQSASGRTTATVRIVIEGLPSQAEKIATLVDAARREIQAQQAVVVLAYRSSIEIGGPFTVGRAYSSVDGRGWSGDGSTEDGPDGGQVVGSVVVALGPVLETQRFSVQR